MAAAGILRSDERVELLDGQLIKMAAKGTAHSSATTRTGKLFERCLAEQAWVRLQEPIQLNDYSEPEPDIAVVQLNALDYADHHPTIAETYLVIEVADTTLKRDCGFKAKIYAQAGVADYWVLDVVERQLHVFREPTLEGYQSHSILAAAATIAPLCFPASKLRINEMLPPIPNIH